MLQSNILLRYGFIFCSFSPNQRIYKTLLLSLRVQSGSGSVKERYKKLIERVYDSEGRGCRHVFDGSGDTDEDCCLTFDSA